MSRTPLSRTEQLDRLRTQVFDVLILGGGINGAGILRDLALRSKARSANLQLGLVDKGHFASGTSGKNSQLIHGGLRYLKNLEFRLVREALHERATLLEIAPHLVEPQPFLIPFYGHLERAFYGTGLFLYDTLAGAQRILKPRHLSRDQALKEEPHLKGEGLTGAAIFQDCRVHSARLVLENIIEAIGNGAAAANYVAAESWQKGSDGLWSVNLHDTLSGDPFTVRAKQLVDTLGPWSREGNLRLVRGSHIVVPRLLEGRNAIAYFEPSGRIIFFIPWGDQFEWTLIGTTDVDHNGSPDDVHISTEETEYLLNIARSVFPNARDLKVLTSYSSLRPLVRDTASSATKTSRDHRIWRDDQGLVHVTGGKYTTYRLMSEQATDLLLQGTPLANLHLTATTALNGNTPEVLETLLSRIPAIAARYHITPAEARAFIRDYGTALDDVLSLAPPDPAPTSLDEARERYAKDYELAQTEQDLTQVSTYWAYTRA